jgi:hypothetical protein
MNYNPADTSERGEVKNLEGRCGWQEVGWSDAIVDAGRSNGRAEKRGSCERLHPAQTNNNQQANLQTIYYTTTAIRVKTATIFISS